MKISSVSVVFGSEADPDLVRTKGKSLNPGALVQTIGAFGIANSSLLEMLAAQTLVAEREGEMLARRREIDFLLRVAGTAQIDEAIRIRGSLKGRPFILFEARLRGKLVKPRVRGGRPLPDRALSGPELDIIERAALLTAQRA